jgi:hypothetical protein
MTSSPINNGALTYLVTKSFSKTINLTRNGDSAKGDQKIFRRHFLGAKEMKKMGK